MSLLDQERKDMKSAMVEYTDNVKAKAPKSKIEESKLNSQKAIKRFTEKVHQIRKSRK